MWQKEEVLKRKQEATKNPKSLIDFDAMMVELGKELDSES